MSTNGKAINYNEIIQYVEDIMNKVPFQRHLMDGYLPFYLSELLYKRSIEKYFKQSEYVLSKEEIIEEVHKANEKNKEYYEFSILKQGKIKKINNEFYELKIQKENE